MKMNVYEPLWLDAPVSIRLIIWQSQCADPVQLDVLRAASALLNHCRDIMSLSLRLGIFSPRLSEPYRTTTLLSKRIISASAIRATSCPIRDGAFRGSRS